MDFFTAKDLYCSPIDEEKWVNLRYSDSIEDLIPKPIYQSVDQLIDHIKLLAPTEFEPSAYINLDGDCLEVWLSNEQYYVERLTNQIEVLVSFQSRQVVGFRLNNLTRVIEDGYRISQ